MAEASGAILRRCYRMPTTINRKSDSSAVTLADREVEQRLREMIEAHYPEHGIIGEEFGNIRSSSDYQWVIDPIDGTRSFIAGYPLFTTLIALAQNGAPVLGIIDQPVSGERWLGAIGIDTTLNGTPVKTSACTTLSDAVLATTSIDYFTQAQAQIFQELKSQISSTILGGDAYAYAMLASGRIDLVVDAGMKPYDYCALKTVIEGAGGVITDWAGKALTTTSDGSVIAAATKELHVAALALLA